MILPVFSLPGGRGIGSLGEGARHFVDFLAKAGQRYWQMLPLGPVGYGESPYSSYSSFAGSPLFIDLDLLAEEGLLFPEELERDYGAKEREVDYVLVRESRRELLSVAAGRASDFHREEREAFRRENGWWLEDYALYTAIKEAYGNRPWTEWPKKLRNRDEEALKKAATIYESRIEAEVFFQYLFHIQWRDLKKYANDKGVFLIGDVPFYTATDSADAWTIADELKLDKERHPLFVAGVPPDAYSADGQHWGNPIYDWEKMKRNGYEFWVRRIGYAATLYDAIRLDHFRGFESFWQVPGKAETAAEGTWEKGPGEDLFLRLRERLGDVPMLLEDLGYLTPEVRELKRRVGAPGSKVIQFAFGGTDSEYLPHNYEKNSVVFTSTHDSDTLSGWLENLDDETRALVIDYFPAAKGENLAQSIVRGAYASTANTALCQLQDVLDIGTEGRINVPGTVGENWKWRATREDFDASVAEKLRHLAKRYWR